jgi:ribosomal protein S27AE
VTSATANFFQKKRQQLQKENPQLFSQKSNLPWWQDANYTQSNRDRPTEPMDAVDDGQHDYSRADSLKSNAGNCPNCASSSFMKPSSSAAARCFDCGYIQGREVNDLNTLDVTISEVAAPRLQVKQTADGGAQKYRGRFSKSGNELRMASAELEQSANGKAYIDS